MFPRHLKTLIEDALTESPVVALVGPRQAGKTTLVRQLVPEAGYRTLDDGTTLAAALADPDGFVSGLRGRPIAIDEVQRAPDLLRAIKYRLERDRAPGQFVLTGSADILTLPTISESLAGRAEFYRLWPLAEAEIAGTRPTFIEHVFGGTEPATLPQLDDRQALIERLLRGGFPELAAGVSPRRRSAWFDSYVTAVVQRDVRDIANIKHLHDLPRILRILAAQTSSLLNVTGLSRATGIPRQSLDRYLAHLEQVFLIRSVQAWHSSMKARQIRSPKVVLVDTGLCAHLAGHSTRSLLAWNDAQIGPLLESFVVTELIKQAAWSGLAPSVYHWRTADGREADAVLEARDGSVVGIEVKASASARDAHFNGLRALRAGIGKRWTRGILLYAGEQIVPFERDLEAWPLATLWAY